MLILGWVSAAPAVETGTLFVYLEVPASYAVATELSVAGISAGAGNSVAALEPLQRHLSASALAGRQILLARAELPAAYYDSLTIVAGRAVLQTGTAEVTPRLRAAGETLALHADLRAGGALVRRLAWVPGPAPEAGMAYRPTIRLVDDVVPPMGALAFVSEPVSGCVLFVDRLAGRVVGAARMDGEPRGMVYSPIRQKLYVAESGTDGIGIVDALTLRRVRNVNLGFGDGPERLALSSDETTLYVLNVGSRSLVAMTTRSMQEQYRVRVGEGPRSLAVDPFTGRVYVACEDEGEIQVFDADGLRRQGSLTSLGVPSEVIVASETRELYVASRAQSRLQGISLADGLEHGNPSLCGPAHYLAFNRHSRQLFAAIPDCEEVGVLRPTEGFEFAPMRTGAEPGHLAFDRSYRQLLVILPRQGAMAIFEANRGTLESRIDLGGRPYAVLVP